MILVAVIAVAAQLTAAPHVPPRTRLAEDSLRARIVRRIAEVPGATVGVAFRDLARAN